MNPDFNQPSGQAPMPSMQAPGQALGQPQGSPQPMQPLQPMQTPPISGSAHGLTNKWMIIGIIAIVVAVIAAGLAAWALIGYNDQKTDVDSKVTSAVADAVKKQKDTDAANFAEQEKQPNRQFAGPDDYGRLSFDYPKTWSIYIAKDASSGGDYLAYFNPVSVPSTSSAQRYALRVTIQNKDYDQVVAGYQSLVKNNSLTASTIKADDQTGTRLDGNFTKDVKGSAVIFKIRDKTVTIQTDAETFKADFDALIKTITFNK